MIMFRRALRVPAREELQNELSRQAQARPR
jgi:hypothetical protein